MSWLLNPNESKRIQHQSFKSKKWIYPASFTTVNPQLKWFQVVPQLVIPLKAALNTRDLALGKYGKSWGSHARRECCSPMWTRHSLEKSSEKIGIQLQVVWCLTFLYQKGKGSTCWLIQRTETTTMLELIAHWSQLHNWLRLQLSPFMSLSPIGPIGHPKCAAAGDPQIMCTTLKLLQKLVLSGDPWRNIAHRAGRILEEKNQRYLGRMLVDVALPNSRAIRR